MQRCITILPRGNVSVKITVQSLVADIAPTSVISKYIDKHKVTTQSHLSCSVDVGAGFGNQDPAHVSVAVFCSSV